MRYEGGSPSRTGVFPTFYFLISTSVRMRSMRNGEVSIIDWLNFSSVDLFNVTAFQNPLLSQGRKPLNWVERHARIAPGTARVVNAHRLVHFHLAVDGFGRCERNFPERNAQIRMNFAREVNLLALRQRFRLAPLSVLFLPAHNFATDLHR